VDNLVQPPLYKLVDLLKDPVQGSYYQSQLKISPNPNDGDYWTIEKVLKKRTRNGKREQLVKFLFYPGMLIKKIFNNEKAFFLFKIGIKKKLGKQETFCFKLCTHFKNYL